MSESFRHDSLHDSLTGMPNRALLTERLEHLAQRAVRTPSNVAVLFADLDDFKAVNDTFGHAVGHDLLVAVAARLSADLRSGDTLARLSGDEFVIVCEDVARPDDAFVLGERIIAAFTDPFGLGGQPVAISASVGIVYAGSGAVHLDRLLQAADGAMYEAKQVGGDGQRLVDLRHTQSAARSTQPGLRHRSSLRRQ